MRFALASDSYIHLYTEQGYTVLEKDEFFSHRCNVLKMTHGVGKTGNFVIFQLHQYMNVLSNEYCRLKTMKSPKECFLLVCVLQLRGAKHVHIQLRR